MSKGLLVGAVVKVICGMLIMGLLIFLPAGSIYYYQGWILMGVLFVPMIIAGFIMMALNPALLKRRLNAREKEKAQRAVIALSALMFMASFILAGLDYRFGLLRMPVWLSGAGVVLFLIAYLLYAEVLRENEYLSRTVEVMEGQKVVDSGLYGLVRHPMYMTTLILFLSMPVILGSWISFIIMLLYIPIIVCRILNEEAVLSAGLEGYSDYMKKVRYRILPFIW